MSQKTILYTSVSNLAHFYSCSKFFVFWYLRILNNCVNWLIKWCNLNLESFYLRITQHTTCNVFLCASVQLIILFLNPFLLLSLFQSLWPAFSSQVCSSLWVCVQLWFISVHVSSRITREQYLTSPSPPLPLSPCPPCSLSSVRQHQRGGGWLQRERPGRVEGGAAMCEWTHGVDQGQREGQTEGGPLGPVPGRTGLCHGEGGGHVLCWGPEDLQLLQPGQGRHHPNGLQGRKLLPGHQRSVSDFHVCSCGLMWLVILHWSDRWDLSNSTRRLVICFAPHKEI